MQKNALEKFSKAEHYTNRTYVWIFCSYVISSEYSAVGDTDSVSYGKPTSLADGSTAMATYLHENFIPLFLEEMDHFLSFYGGEFVARDQIILQKL